MVDNPSQHLVPPTPIPDPTPAPIVLTPQQVADLLAKNQNDMWVAIQTQRDNLRFNGVLVGSNWFKSDSDNRTEIEGMLLIGANLPAGQTMTSLAGVEVPLTQTLVAQIFQALVILDATCYAVAKTHHVNMLAATDPLAYNYSTGWPATYAGA